MENLDKKVVELKKEARIFRSFMIGSIISDNEGEYNKNFVKETLKSVNSGHSSIYKDKESFLKELRK